MKQTNKQFWARTPAKITLSLAVTGKRDGLHTLDMIVCPWEGFADEAFFTPEKSPSTSAFPHIQLDEVVAEFNGFDISRFKQFFLPKLDLIARQCDICGRLKLRLGVPLGAGLGGSSAMTVAALKAVENCLSFSGREFSPSPQFLLSLGSDVPCMYLGGVCRVQGVGEVLTPLPDPAPNNIRVIIPPCKSDTAASYALFDDMNARGKIPTDLPVPSCVDEAILSLRNDLTLPACALHPEISSSLGDLARQNIRAIVCGSGSAIACFLP